MAQRDGYSAFVDDWLPSYTGNGGADPDLTREKVWEEVVEKYDIREVYNKKIQVWREEVCHLGFFDFLRTFRNLPPTRE